MPPHESIEVPLPEFIREAAKESARTVIREHVKTCPIQDIDKRVHVLEKRFNILVGAVIGSGALGGTVAAGILKLVG